MTHIVGHVRYHGSAELTFPDSTCLVAAARVLVTVEAGFGGLRISPGHVPSMSEVVTALESGPFTLTFDGGMLSCQPLQWTLRTSEEGSELLMVFEAEGCHHRPPEPAGRGS
jgi:hypothetical protein